MIKRPKCPGCKHELEPVSGAGRPDDLYLCSRCYHSWFRFELADEEFVPLDSPDNDR